MLFIIIIALSMLLARKKIHASITANKFKSQEENRMKDVEGKEGRNFLLRL
jgi:hypothetical protein